MEREVRLPGPEMIWLVGSKSPCCLASRCSWTVCSINSLTCGGSGPKVPFPARGEVATSLAMSMVTGSGITVAFGCMMIILPAGTATLVLLPLIESLWVPSRVRSLIHPPGLYSNITVVPVMAAVTVAVRMVAPPAFLGTWSKTDPCFNSTLRPPSRKLKTEFWPKRVIVLSLKVSSVRDWRPVCTDDGVATFSPTVARWAALEPG